ncbi:NADPH-dependent F420 reductase [Pseudaestuariivita sp.]|uniref:NADPH-dependent F420 reductase n=1 Tax=Pseudaestuariivita sp. TaxID=2211669 RepID=UPI004058974B
MNIAIIGTGNIASGLARTFGRTSHGVALAGRTLDKAEALAETLHAEAGIRVQAADIPTAVSAADVILFALPFEAALILGATAAFDGKIVIDVTNPLTADFSGLTLGHDTSAAEEIQRALPGATVVKAFNTVFAQVYAEGLDFGGRKAPAFVAADDTAAKDVVLGLACDGGFDPVDAGALANARYLEPLAALNIQFGYMLGQGTQIVPAWLSR